MSDIDDAARARVRIHPDLQGTITPVLSSLASSDWTYRTIDGISKETQLPRSKVVDTIRVLATDEGPGAPPLVRKSSLHDRNGRELYALAGRDRTMKERLATFRSLLDPAMKPVDDDIVSE
jgi:hypothetical protein